MQIFHTYVPQGITWFYAVMAGLGLIMLLTLLQKKLRVWWYYGIVAFVVSAVTWACFEVHAQAHAVVVVESGKRLTVKAGSFSPDLSWEEIEVDGIRRVSLRGEKDLRPAKRDFGTGMSNFAAGHFTLQNGQKAFIILVRNAPEDSAVVIPVKNPDKEYVILLNLQNPDGFLVAVKKEPQ